VYNDNVDDPRLQKWLGKVVGKESEDLSRHDKWLCMMYPRLKLLHRLLAKDGAIFISIDDNEQANLKLICDEIFGVANFVNNIIWQKKYSPQNDAKYLSDMHDVVVCYAKNKINWERTLLPRNEEQNKRYKNPDKDPRGNWKASDLSVKTYNKNTDYKITTPSGRVVTPPDGRCWGVTQPKFEEMVKDNRIWFGKEGKNVPSVKKFLSEVQSGSVPLTIWLREEAGDNQEAKQDLKKILSEVQFPFDTPKPARLVDKVLRISTNKNDIILDSFAGSGTTAHAVLNLNKQDGGNRKFILVEMEDYADAVTAERVKRVIKGYGKDKKAVEGTGGDFTYYTLGEPMFLEDEMLNESLGEEAIRQYVWYTETQAPYVKPKPRYLMGIHQDTAYYFYYEAQRATTLDEAFLRTLDGQSSQYIIYADMSLLGEQLMKKLNIIFKKIPRDITRF
jgi:adenine-specific DNA-methyltransferase